MNISSVSGFRERVYGSPLTNPELSLVTRHPAAGIKDVAGRTDARPKSLR
jgi:hypothetical protein